MEEITKNGFFVMEDGQRSCDVIVKKKAKKGGDEGPVKAVKTRDRACQTDDKEPRSRPKKQMNLVEEDDELDVGSSSDASPVKPSLKRRLKDQKQAKDDSSPSPGKKRVKMAPAAAAKESSTVQKASAKGSAAQSAIPAGKAGKGPGKSAK